MGRRGPAPTPSAILRARGSWRGAANKGEPKPPEGVPDRPVWLSATAGEVWEQLLRQLTPLGLASEIDANALARYCDALVRFKKAAAFIEKNGEVYTIKDKDGNVKCVLPWPQVGIYHKLAALLGKIESEFGLTPASRSRISVKLDDEGEEQRDAHPTEPGAVPSLRIAG